MTDVATNPSAPRGTTSRPLIIERDLTAALERHLQSADCVLLTGPYEVGKSTVVTALAEHRGAGTVVLNPSAPGFAAALEAPLSEAAGKLIIIDEIQDAPETLKRIRCELDRWHNQRIDTASFLLASSRPLDAKRLVDECLGTRAKEFSLSPISLPEYTAARSPLPRALAQAPTVDIEPVSSIDAPTLQQHMETLWLRGGYPRSLLAASNRLSYDWRNEYLLGLCNRSTTDQRPDYPSTDAHDLLRIIALNCGSHQTIEGRRKRDFADHLSHLGILRILGKWDTNIERRTRAARKVFLRDTGLLHSLLQAHAITDLDAAHLGYSWETFCLQQLISAAPHATAYYYRDDEKNEIDLVLEFSPHVVLAIEIKYHGGHPKKGFYRALEILRPARGLVVKPNPDPGYRGSAPILSLADMIAEVRSTAASAYSPSAST
jgi:predicted AAA+ superfamily ATPase